MTLTHGRVRLEKGVVPLVPRFDTAGFFVRTVDDAELLLAAWCGDDGHGPLPDELPQDAFERPVFLGFARRGFMELTDDEAAHHSIHTAKLLSQRGAIVHVLKVPDSYETAMEHHRRIFAYEASHIHRLDFQRAPESFSPNIARLVEDGFRVTQTQYQRALETLDHLRQDMLARISEVDAIVLPAATGPAPLGLDNTGDPSCNAPWTAIGFPCVTIPSGAARNGLPLGLQLVGRPTGERFLLRVARFCERVLGVGPRLGARA
jgi:Asp-tRNA(Asn)/Glu-tRNA(Gln) amidotransferase A subunit family amidase